MAVTDQQKLDFLLKKIGFTKTKTGSTVGTGAISGTPKQPFAEAIPSPLIIANGALWNESDQITATPPGSDTNQIKVYSASSALRMTADATSSGQRAYIAYSTYNDTSSTRLTNWIDTQFGALYLIKVYKGDPNSGGVALSAGATNENWFFDYSAGVLNFNDSNVPSGVTDTNIYIVGYRYIGQTGAPTSGIGTFSFKDLTVERNLDVGPIGGISTFRNSINALDIIKGYKYTAAPYSGTTTTLTVTVASKVSGQHRYHGQGSSLGYVIDGLQSPFFTLTPGNTYRFDQSDNSNGSHQIKFYLEADKTTLYEEGVTYNGSAGNSGAYTQIVVSDKTPVVLHYQCINHGYMGNAFQTNANVVNTNYEATIRSGLNVSGVTTHNEDVVFTGANTNARWDHSTSDLILFDDTRLEFGSNKDFEIWHGGAHTYLKNSGGDLRIRGDKILLKKADDSERYLEATVNSDVKLFFNGNEKFATTIGGVNIIGHVETDTLQVSGLSTFAGDIDVDGHTNLDNLSVAGVSTFTGDATFSGSVSIGGTLTYEDVTNVDSVGLLTARSGIRVTGGVIEALAGENKIPSLYATMGNLPSAGTYHGMFAHVHNQGKGYFAHGGAWYELVNKELNGRVGTGTESYFIDRLVSTSTTATSLNVAGVSTFAGEIDANGRIVGAQLANVIPFYYDYVSQFPSASTYHGAVAHAHNTGRLYFAHAGWKELVNKESDGRVGLGTESYFINSLVSTSTTATSLNVVGVSTFSGNLDINADIDVDGHVELDNVNIAGVTTFAGNIDANADLDVDGHTNLDNVSVAGVTTHSSEINMLDNQIIRFGTAAASRTSIFYDSSGSNTWIKNFNDTLKIGYRPVEIYYVNQKRLEFINGGNRFTTDVTTTFLGDNYHASWSPSSNRFQLNDNAKLAFGSQADTNIFHNNSHLYIQNTTGNIDVTGNVELNNDLDVDGHTNLDNVSIAGIVTANSNMHLEDYIFHKGDLSAYFGFSGDDTILFGTSSAQRLRIASNGKITVFNDLDVDGTTDLDVLNVAEAATFSSSAEFDGNAKFDSTITAGGSTGTNGQYLKSTGSGVAWASFPTARTSQAFTASAGQTTFSFSYTVGLVDVFVNGIKLSTSEFTATNGSSVVLAVGCFVGDIVEILSYNTATGGGGGGGTLSNIVEDTTPQLGGNLDLFSKTINGTGGINITGVVTATSFVGDGSALTGVVGSGSGVVIQHDGSNVGTAGTINFSTNLDVTPISAGIVTVTASGGGSGITTAEVRANTLVVTGVSTLTGTVNLSTINSTASNLSIHNTADRVLIKGSNRIDLADDQVRFQNRAQNAALLDATSSYVKLYQSGNEKLSTTSTGVSITGSVVATGADINGDIDVDGHTNLDNVSIAGVVTATTFKGALEATSASFSSNIDANGDLDVDGHTNLDNVSVAGVTTFANDVKFDGSSASIYANWDQSGNALFFRDNSHVKFGNNNGMELTHSGGASGNGNINNRQGGLVIRTTGSDAGDIFIDSKDDIQIRTHDTSNSILCTGGAGVKLYFAGGEKFETTTKGIQVGTGVTVETNGQATYTGIITAQKFVGDGSGLTGITASGSGIVIKHDGSTVGTAGTINFGTNLDVSAISGGAVTITASGGGSGISTISGVVNIVNDLDVDGHTNLDNVSIAGVTTISYAGSTSALIIDKGNASSNAIEINTTSTSNACRIRFNESGSNKAQIAYSHDNDRLELVAHSGNEIAFYSGGNLTTRINTDGHLYPNTDSTYDLGLTGTRWRNLYADTLYGDGSNLTGVNANVGITTNLSGSFTASAGSPSTINTFGYGSGDIVVEYTVFIKNGSNFQSQKLLAMRDGTTIHSTQFAVMFSSSLLVQLDATISGGNILLRATPETGISGSTTYKVKREVM